MQQPPWLVALHVDVAPQKYFIETDICTIGRSTMCQIVVARNTVSRLHAKIEREGPRYMLSDTNSANGTYVNGHRLREPHLLEDNDLIGLSSEAALMRFADPESTVQVVFRLQYDSDSTTFSLNRQPLDLTPTQSRLLRHLYLNAGSVCNRQSCAEAIWDREYDPSMDAAALDKVVSTLRGRLGEIDPKADLIETRRGVGYILHL